MKEMMSLAPKQWLRLATARISFLARSFFSYWFLSLPASIGLLLLTSYLLPAAHWQRHLHWALLGIVLAVAGIGALLRYRNACRPIVWGEGYPIALTEVVIIEEKEYLKINSDSQKITTRLHKMITELVTIKYPFCNGVVAPVLLKKPALYYTLHDLASWRKNLEQEIKKGKLATVLLITRDSHNQKIDFDVLYSEVLENADSPFEDFKRAFDGTVPEEHFETYIIEVCRAYLALFGQSIMDLLIGKSNFSLAHQVLQDCEFVFRHALKNIESIQPTRSALSLSAFKNNMLCNFERYRAIVFLNQESYAAAVQHIFKAIWLHSYFPYRDYDHYKEAFNKIYAAQVHLKAMAMMEPEATGRNAELSENALKEEEDIAMQVEFAATPSFEDILKEIMSRADSGSVYRQVEQLLCTSFCEEPVCSVIRGEVIKYIPKWEEKINEIYRERIPEALQAYEKVLQTDPDFILMYTRIGSLKTLEAMHEDDEVKSKELLEEGIRLFAQGQEIYQRLGYD